MSFDRAALEVDVRHRLGTLQLNARFDVRAPWTVLFGPSGSGKSTLLRVVAGLIRAESGRIAVLGERVQDADVWVPAHRRRIRWAGQRPALFPRKTVRWNIALAMDSETRGGAGRAKELEIFLESFGLLAIADRRPAELSGGQRQLVSVARAAIAARNKVLLLDEPFSGLDAVIRERLIGSLRGWLGDARVLSVTHDVSEAFLLGAEVVRLADGEVAAQGPVSEVLAAERHHLRKLLG